MYSSLITRKCYYEIYYSYLRLFGKNICFKIIKNMLGVIKLFRKPYYKPFSSPYNCQILNYFSDQKQTDLEKRRKEIMAKGLPKQKPIKGVKHIVLVCSGKGGVGKSTASVNLATALRIIQPEKEVGLLDTDVFGPSIPLMMNLHEEPFLTKDNLMEPLMNYGVKCMSMGFLIGKDAPVIWRGLMVMQALERLMRQVDWGQIDYLIVDTPPGTGDTHLSLIQNLPISGVVLVTTPQSASLQVTKRGAMMFKKLKVPIIGIIENMSPVKCTSCSADIKIFGDGTDELAKDLECKILGSFPLNKEVSLTTDKGVPIVIDNSESCDSQLYKQIAQSVVNFLRNKEMSHV